MRKGRTRGGKEERKKERKTRETDRAESLAVVFPAGIGPDLKAVLIRWREIACS